MVKASLPLVVAVILAGCTDQTPPKETSVVTKAEPAPAAQPQKWKYAKGENYAHHSKIAFAKLYSEPAADGSQYELNVRAERPGTTEVFLSLGPAFVCDGIGTAVTVTFDRGEGQRIKCRPSTTGNAASIFGYQHSRLLSHMAAADVMKIVIHEGDGTDKAVTFRPSGYNPAPAHAPDMSDVYQTF